MVQDTVFFDRSKCRYSKVTGFAYFLVSLYLGADVLAQMHGVNDLQVTSGTTMNEDVIYAAGLYHR
jgi:hypothetical protein